ncbi:MAG: hypothetical protein ACREQ5_06360 [Candidatus Dormibacteria bacterium]
MPKGKAVWWILRQADEVLVPLYKGPDKKRAREVAAKNLGDKGKDALIKDSLIAVRVTSVTVLSESNLKTHLPKDAF